MGVTRVLVKYEDSLSLIHWIENPKSIKIAIKLHESASKVGCDESG